MSLNVVSSTAGIGGCVSLIKQKCLSVEKDVFVVLIQKGASKQARGQSCGWKMTQTTMCASNACTKVHAEVQTNIS